ncbi:MAG: sigma-54-dependent Fis family transcriptional regulator, partial [Deltaproteobacteria bacterium]
MKKNKTKILIVDDDEGMRDTLESILRDYYDVLKAGDGERALEMLEKNDVNIVLLDILLPGMDGLTVLENIREYHKDIDVIVGSVVKKTDHIVRAIKLGAYDYLTKDFDYDEIRLKINRLVEHRKRERELVSLQEKIGARMENEFIIGKNSAIRMVWETVKSFSKSDLPIFISGEPGTGKRLLAREIHELSDRTGYPYVPVNLHLIPKNSVNYILFGRGCASPSVLNGSPVSKIERAGQGTLVLYGIESLSRKNQQRLLTVLEDRKLERTGRERHQKIDFRLITVSERTTDILFEDANFDPRLLTKISKIKIELPPLRERFEDIPELTRYFIKKYSGELNKSPITIKIQALNSLLKYHWPGNVAELENLMQKLVITASGPKITKNDIPLEYVAIN